MSLERVLKIHIPTTGDTSGVEKVNSALGNLAEKATEGWRETDKLRESHVLLRGILHQVGEQTVPQLAEALHGAFLGPIGLAISLGAAVKYVQERLEAYNKTLDEAADRAADPTFQEGIKAKREELEKLALAADAFADKMRHLITPEEEFKAAVHNATEALHAQFEAIAAIDDAQKGAAVSEIEKRRKLGQISDSDAIIQRAQVEKAYHDKKVADAQAESDQMIQIKQKELEHEQARTTAADVAKAHQAASATAGKAAQDQKDQETLAAKQKDLDADATKAEAAYDQAVIDAQFRNPRATGTRADDVAPYLKALNDAKDAAEQNRKAEASLRGKLPDEKEDAAAAERASARAETADEERTKRIDALEHELALLRDIQKIKADAAGPIKSAADREADAKTITEMAGTKSGEDIVRARLIEEQLRLHQKVAADDLAWFESWKHFLIVNGQVTAASMDVMRQATETVENFRRELDAVKAAQKTANLNSQGH